MAKRGEKALRKLANRIRGWEEMRGEGSIHHGKVKIVRGHSFRKPGSLKK